MPRFTPLDAASMTQRQREAAGRIGAGARGGVKGPFPAWLHSPEMAEHFERLGRFLRWETRLPSRLSELAILVTARHWRARYEWYAHLPLALEGGLDPAIAEAVRRGERPAAMAPDEGAVHDFVAALHQAGTVEDAVFEAARRLFGEAGVAELIGLAGYYTAVAYTLNVAEVALPEGEADPFA